MIFHVPKKVIQICKILDTKGFDSWVVGGCVRDSLLRRRPHDWDIATTALPEDITRIFDHTIPTGIEFGTVTVLMDKEPFEITTLRKDGNYGDGRRPDNVSFSTDIEEDLSRRDFTVNAIAFDVIHERLIDPFYGFEDLQKSILHAVGDPTKRFNEDGLRIMRAARFSATHNLRVHHLTIKGMTLCKENIKNVSKERIRDEILKSLSADKPSIAFNILRETGILKLILPDLSAQHGCQQNHHHVYDVWQHTMSCIDLCDTNDIVLKTAILLHDIGKVKTQIPRDGCLGEFRFLEHEEVGAEIANEWLREYKFSNEDRERIVHLIRHHLVMYGSLWSKKAVRRFINKIGVENLDDFFTVRIADLRGKGKDVDEHLENIVELSVRIQGILEEGDPVVKSQLLINGHDVQEKLGVKPGPVVGRALEFLFDAVLENPELNEKEVLLGLLDKFYKELK